MATQVSLDHFTNVLARVPLLLLTGFALSLTACISYEPRVLVPAITLSPEDITLAAATGGTSDRVNFGLEVAVNESDSLLNVEVLPGIRVRTVNPNGPADAAGIQPGDVILAVNNTPTNHPDALAAIAQRGTTEPYEFTVRRNTVVFAAALIANTVSTSTGPQELYRADPVATRAGYRSELVTIRNQPAVPAARVVELFPGSPLPDAAVNRGDLVLAINGASLNSAQDLINRVNRDFAPGEQIEFTVYDGSTVSTKTVRLWDPGRRISRLSLGPVLRYESTLSPSTNSLTVLDLWLFAFYRYNRVDGERSHSILGLLNFSSNYGELTDETN